MKMLGFLGAETRTLCIKLLAILFVAGGIFSSVNVAEGADTGSLIVKLEDGLSLNQQAIVIARNGGTETSSIPVLRLHVITVATADIPLVRQKYQFDTQVVSVEMNKTRKAEGFSTEFGGQWALPKIGWDKVFGTVVPNGTAKIALLDTGIDASHPDLSAAVIPGTSFLDLSNGLSDPNGHGTSLAGIVAGVAYQGVSIMPVTVLNASGLGQDSDIIAGIFWAVDHGADVILMGFSNPDFSQNLQDAIDYAWLNGAVLVSAAGNDGVSTASYPAGDRGVIGVSAADQDDRLAYVSNYGLDTFLAAPGTNIYTTGINGNYGYITGTSASSAFVAGVAGFMKAADPALANGVIVGRLARSADAVGTADDPNNPLMFGNGRLNMAQALADTGTDAVQPAGAAPLGEGGPYVGPYTAAASNYVSIGISGQNETLAYGTAGTASYTVTVTRSGSGVLNVALGVTTSLPTGASASFEPPTISFTGNSPASRTSTLTVTTKNTTPAGYNTSFTVEGSVGGVVKTVNGAITISKATPAITAWPTASAISYQQTLASSTLSGGQASPSGNFSFTAPLTAPSAGTASQVVTFTPNDTVNYTTSTGSVSVTVNKADPSVIAWPTASAINYPQTLASSTLSGGQASPSGSFSFTAPLTAPSAGTASQGVTFTPNDTVNYTTTTGSVSVTVNKADPSVTVWPTASSISYPQTLASSTLTGGQASPSGSFSFTAPSTAPNAGTASQGVTFTPNDTVNYNTAAGSVNVTVNKADPNVTAWPSASAISYLQTLASSTLAGGQASPSGHFSFTAPLTAPSAGTASQGVIFTPNDTVNYTTVTGSVNVTVNKADPNVTYWPTAGAISYPQTLASSTLTGGQASPSGHFSFTAPLTAPNAGTASLGVTFTPNDTVNYNTATGSVSVTVNKADPNVTAWPTASAISYPQTLASSTLSGGQASTLGSFSFTAPSTAPNAGTASQGVTFTPNDTVNYTTATGSVSVTVNKADPSVTAWPTASTISYPQTLASSTLSGGQASTLGRFSFTAPLTGPNAGTASQGVTFTPNDTVNYTTATGSVSVTVNKADPSVTAWPTAGAISYRQTLASSILSGGQASPSGSFSFTAPSTAPNAGTASHGVTFIPNDTVNYNSATGSVSVTVNKADPNVTAWPTASAISYPQTLASSTLSGGQASTSGSFSFTAPSTAPNAGTASQGVTFTPTNPNYTAVTGWASVTVNKATPVITVWPTASAILNGKALSASTLTGGNPSVPGTFAFTTSALKPNAGTAMQNVTFTPTDTSNYNTVSGALVVSVPVICSLPVSITVPATNATDVIRVSWTGSTVSGVNYVLECSLTGASGTYTTAYNGTYLWADVPAPAAGTYTFRVKVTKAGYDPSANSAAKGCAVTLLCGIGPTITVPANNATETIRVSWTQSSLNGVKYVLEYSTDGFQTFTTAYNGTYLWADVTVPNETYTFRVKVTKPGYTDSSYSASGSCIEKMICGLPATITVPASNLTGSFRVNWGASQSSGVNYVLEYSKDNFTSVITTAYNGTYLWADVTVPTSGTYQFRVKAIKSGYDSSDYRYSSSVMVNRN